MLRKNDGSRSHYIRPKYKVVGPLSLFPIEDVPTENALSELYKLLTDKTKKAILTREMAAHSPCDIRGLVAFSIESYGCEGNELIVQRLGIMRRADNPIETEEVKARFSYPLGVYRQMVEITITATLVDNSGAITDGGILGEDIARRIIRGMMNSLNNGNYSERHSDNMRGMYDTAKEIICSNTGVKYDTPEFERIAERYGFHHEAYQKVFKEAYFELHKYSAKKYTED